MKNSILRVGFLINPYAGLGGPLAQKGSDDVQLAQRAVDESWQLSALARAQVFLSALKVQNTLSITWVSADGDMGGKSLIAEGFNYCSVCYAYTEPSVAQDTVNICELIIAEGVDLLVFVGGDGTAREVLNALPRSQPALGVPAGVKMQSGVYAITPQSAAELIVQMAAGGLIRVTEKEVRDIDESAFQKGIVKSQYYGDMTTLDAPEYVQHVKQGGLEVEDLVILDIAEHLKITWPKNALIIVGPGSTTHSVLSQWYIDSTLLGVDLLLDGECIARDVDAQTIRNYINNHSGPLFVLVTVIGGQGHIIGRGNQQIAADILQKVGRDHLQIIATKTKLKTLDGRPLLIDSGNLELDQSWQGYIPVITGYEDTVMYRVGFERTVEEELDQGAEQNKAQNVGCETEQYHMLLQPALEFCTGNDKSICRLLHGRGGCYPGLEQVTLDGFDQFLLLTLFKPIDEGFESMLRKLGDTFWQQHNHSLIVQRRYLPGTPYELVKGSSLPRSMWVTQDQLKYQLRFTAQNTGLFLDMQCARDWLQSRVKGKRVLNLFAYTCAFSVVAMANGAEQCTNVDMSSSALTWGRENHHQNQIATANVQFLAVNILKSWSRIKKYGPYDVIIIDPPSFQKGSFVAGRDYAKIVKRIEQFAAPGAEVLACLNAPELPPEFLMGVFAEHWPQGEFVRRLALPEAFKDVDANKQLKIMQFNAAVK